MKGHSIVTVSTPVELLNSSRSIVTFAAQRKPRVFHIFTPFTDCQTSNQFYCSNSVTEQQEVDGLGRKLRKKQDTVLLSTR